MACSRLAPVVRAAAAAASKLKPMPMSADTVCCSLCLQTKNSPSHTFGLHIELPGWRVDGTAQHYMHAMLIIIMCGSCMTSGCCCDGHVRGLTIALPRGRWAPVSAGQGPGLR